MLLTQQTDQKVRRRAVGRVGIRLLMWSGKDLGPEWQSPTDARATMEVEVREGTTVRQFLDNLAERYPIIREQVFPEHDLGRYIVAMLNDTGMGKDELLATTLHDGDVLTVLPIVVGG